MNDLHRQLDIFTARKIRVDYSRDMLIRRSVAGNEVLLAQCGVLVRTAPEHSRGRSPKATYIVAGGESHKYVDWESPNNKPIDRSTFESLLKKVVKHLDSLANIVVLDRVIGADDTFAIPVQVITNKSSVGLFADNMFREATEGSRASQLNNKKLIILAVPDKEPDIAKLGGRMAIATDFNRGVGIVCGCAYYGAIKKLAFTYANYWLPHFSVLPMHCGANADKYGNSTLFLGLSGTGKTTLSTDVHRPIIGDDEHGWTEGGIFNLEGGCYAKLAHLSERKEPGIWHAFHRNIPYAENGAIIENAKMDENGILDFNDTGLTENARVSFPLSHLENVEPGGKGDHPNTIIFLTADAHGVLPPVARLNHNQALLWFLLGYTSKLAGTETGVTTPKSTFSRFFGAPFMSRHPEVYLDLFSERITKHKTQVYLVNTGWTGGSFGVGSRMDIPISRAVVTAAVSGALNEVAYRTDKLFKFAVPVTVPGVDEKILNPRDTWDSLAAYDLASANLAREFAQQIETYAGHNLNPNILTECPSV